jgi:hypothetical protein
LLAVVMALVAGSVYAAPGAGGGTDPVLFMQALDRMMITMFGRERA